MSEDKEVSILEEAIHITTHDRNEQYGPPNQDFERSARMVTELLAKKLVPGTEISPVDIARIVICIKLSRSTWMSKRDNWVDIAGYAACAHYCERGTW